MRVPSDLGYCFVTRSEWESSGVYFPEDPWCLERVFLPWQVGASDPLACLWSGYYNSRYIILYSVRSWLWNAVFPRQDVCCRRRIVARRCMPRIACYDYVRWPPRDVDLRIELLERLSRGSFSHLGSLEHSSLARRIVVSDWIMAESFQEIERSYGKLLSKSPSRLLKAWLLGFRHLTPRDARGRIMGRREYEDRVLASSFERARRRAARRRSKEESVICDDARFDLVSSQ